MADKHPTQFYHGTQTAVHLTDNPYLEPRLSKGGDVGDPEQPHVFVTPNKLMAKIFALKAPNVVSIGLDSKSPMIVLLGEPKSNQGGWLYKVEEDPAKPFEEVRVNGQPTGKWYGFQKTSIKDVEAVPDMKHLMQTDRLQVMVLPENTNMKEWTERQRQAAYSGKGAAFYAEEIRSGRLRHLNAEMGINPDSRYIQKNTDKAPPISTALNKNAKIATVSALVAGAAVGAGFILGWPVAVIAVMGLSLSGMTAAAMVFSGSEKSYEPRLHGVEMPSALKRDDKGQSPVLPALSPQPSQASGIEYRNDHAQRYLESKQPDSIVKSMLR
jgi:hypothetical protein